MKYSFEDYINNPMGYKNSVFTNKSIYYTTYKKKLDIVLLREAGDIKYVTYKNKDIYYIHIKVPSEVIPKFYYDVVIEFAPKLIGSKAMPTLKDYNIKFFSNDPAFVFTFAHAMIKNKLFITDLIPKMSKEAIKNVAKERNPKKQIGYVKSLFFAYLIMENNKLFKKSNFEKDIQPYHKETLLQKITDSDKKIKARQDLTGKSNKKVEKEEPEKKSPRESKIARSKTVATKNTKSVKSVSSIKKNSNIKKR